MNVQEMIDAAERQTKYTEEWVKRTDEQAGTYTPAATGDLSELQISRDRYYPDVLAFGAGDSVAPELLELAAFGLREYIDAAAIERLPKVICAARIEYARAEFHAALFASLICQEIRPDRKEKFVEYSQRCRERGWDDADIIAANPITMFDSPATNFVDWLASVERGGDEFPAHLARSPCAMLDPPIPPSVLPAGLVAVWIDAALHRPNEANTFLAHAMELFGFVRWTHGWDAANECVKQDRTRAAKKAADARHQTHRDMKQRVITAYRNGSFPSKDAAAMALAKGGIPLSFRTIRDALKDA